MTMPVTRLQASKQIPLAPAQADKRARTDAIDATDTLQPIEEDTPQPIKENTVPTPGSIRALPADIRAHMSTIAGKKNAVISSAKKPSEKDRAALPLGTWVVDAYVGGAATESRFRHEYYLRFVDKATGKRRTYGCATKKGFVEALRLHVRWCRSIAPITERKHGLQAGTLDIRIIASDTDANMGTIRGAVRSAFDDLGSSTWTFAIRNYERR